MLYDIYMKKFLLYIIVCSFSVFLGASVLADKAHAVDIGCIDLRTYLVPGSTDISAYGEVSVLQDFLRARGYLDHVTTGYFGPLTSHAVKMFQVDQGLPVVGVVGPLTRATIQEISCALSLSTIEKGEVPIVIEPQAISMEHDVLVGQSNPEPTLPYHKTSFSGWRATWGNVKAIAGGNLLLTATAETIGAEVLFLDAGSPTNYRYIADVTVSNGDITLIGHYVDHDNFIACNFSRNIVSILRIIGGETHILRSVIVEGMPSEPYFLKSTNVSMRVEGNTVACTAVGPGENISYTFSEHISAGMIGIQTKYPYPGASVMHVRGVRVDSI